MFLHKNERILKREKKSGMIYPGQRTENYHLQRYYILKQYNPHRDKNFVTTREHTLLYLCVRSKGPRILQNPKREVKYRC